MYTKEEEHSGLIAKLIFLEAAGDYSEEVAVLKQKIAALEEEIKKGRKTAL